MQHTSPPHTTTSPPHAAIHTRRLDYIHVPLTPHSIPQSTPTMTTTLFHLQQHPFTSPTVSTERISKILLYYTKVRSKKPNHHHNLTSCRPMYALTYTSDTQCAGMSSLHENCWVWHMACRWHAHSTHPQMKKVKHTHKTKWLLAIMCLEDQRPKQAYCDGDRFQVSPLGVTVYSEGKCSLCV